jgi:dihydropteroate synthase
MISIDTRAAEVAAAALTAGANIVNDVSALRDDPGMVDVVRRTRAWVVLMHRFGDAQTMQAGGGPHYDDVVAEVFAFLRDRVEWAVAQGVERSRIIVDPGIGFGKRVEDNFRILGHLERFRELGRPILIGASRKRFLGMTLGLDAPEDRDVASFACAALAARAGVLIVRGHTVKGTAEAVRLGWAARRA